MKTTLQHAFRWLAKWQVVLVCGVSTVVFVLFFSAVDRTAPAGTSGIIELELAFSEDRFSDIIHQWAEVGVLPLQRRSLWIDFVFPFAYVCFLSSLLAWLALGPGEKPSQGLLFFLMLPFIAGLFDWVENALLLSLLRSTSSFSQPLILLASAVSTVKWVLVLVCALAILYHVFRPLVGLVRRRGPSG